MTATRSSWGAVVLALALLIGCSETERERTPDSGQLTDAVVAVTKAPSTLDPVKIIDVDSLAVALAVHAPLGVVEPSGWIRPILASKLEMAEDASSAVITLREGVTCWDGSPMTIADIIATFERFRRSSHPHRWILDKIAGVEAFDAGAAESIAGLEVIDARTIRVRFERPDPDFLKFVSSSALLITKGTIPAEALPYDTHVVGCGPFKPIRIEPGIELDLARNDGFPIASNLQSLTFRILSNPQQQLREMESGVVHLIRLQGPMLAEAIEVAGSVIAPRGAFSDAKVMSSSANEMVFLTVNSATAPFGNMAAAERRAWIDRLSQGLARPGLISSLYLGQGKPAYSVVPPTLGGRYDPPKAEAAGGTWTGSIDLTCPNDPDSRRLGHYLQSRAGALGIDLRLEFIDLNRLVGRILSKDYELALLWVENQIPAGVVGWLSFFSPGNPVSALGEPINGVTEGLSWARSMVSDEDRLRAYDDLIAKIDSQQTSWIPLISRDAVYLVDDRLSGVLLDANGLLYFASLTSSK